VRIIPVSEGHIGFCKIILKELESERIRVDLDDENETVGKKIRRAEKEWIPFIIVIGDKEAKTHKLTVRIRADGGVQKTLFKKELVDRVQSDVKGKPFLPLPLHRELSKRPKFR
jgi:threonyl-tRNA synthetase